jgi:6-phosphogluconolactonase (cycloisomerase 2 family)
MISKTLTIPIDDIKTPKPTVYIGNKGRHSTATSVALMKPDVLVVCHFDGCRMFALHFDIESGAYRKISELPTTFSGKPCETDLMAANEDGLIATSNFYLNTCSRYQFDQDGISFLRDLPYDATDRVHGIKFYKKNVIALTTRGKVAGVHFFDTENCTPTYQIRIPNQSVQDVCFVKDGLAVILSTHGHPNLRPFKIYNSSLYLVRFHYGNPSLSVLAEKTLKDSHLACVSLHGNYLFVTDQFNNAVRVFEAQDLNEITQIKGYDFPHGCDTKFNILAVTNYGNNTVTLSKIGSGST